MLREIAGIDKVQKLYVQLLYHCNFRCLHCFQGRKLSWSDAFTLDEVVRLLDFFRREYDIKSVTFLGGEPFLHPAILDCVAYAHSLGLCVEVCTNGFKILKRLATMIGKIDNLRVSIDGLEATHDHIRQHGSFQAAMDTIDFALANGVPTSATVTINACNYSEVASLANLLFAHGITELKLHALRTGGNVVANPFLILHGDRTLHDLRVALDDLRSRLRMTIILDEDLDPSFASFDDRPRTEPRTLDRIEIEPNGHLYVSCKAVGTDANAFEYDKNSAGIYYRPTSGNELECQIPQVRYSAL